MADWDDVQALAMAMPEATERRSNQDLRQWRIKDRMFVWERPLLGTELTALGATAPDGPILGARVDFLETKDVLIATESEAFFTTPHLDGYPAVLVRLGEIDRERLRDLVIDAWLARAPKRLADAYRAEHAE